MTMKTHLLRFACRLAALASLLIVAPKVVAAEPTHEVLWTFRQPPKNPASALVLGSDGYYWGTTNKGGTGSQGTIYKTRADGSDWQTVISFTGDGPTNRGARPFAGLVSDSAGSLWGTTPRGGTSDFGTVFKVDINTGVLTTVFEATPGDPINRGRYPNSELVYEEGFFWGTTAYGGPTGSGTVFRIDAMTGMLTTVADSSDTTFGFNPSFGLVSDHRGFLWGVTVYGGTAGGGTIFKVRISDGELTTVVQFGALREGLNPLAGLVNGDDGFMWGTCANAGVNGTGTVFKVDIDTGVLITVADFPPMTPGYSPEPSGRLVSDGNDSFLGVTRFGGADRLGTIFKVNRTTEELKTVFEFSRDQLTTVGANPLASLISLGADAFLGTTSEGGPNGNGTVYQINPTTGELTTLVTFNVDDGAPKKGHFPVCRIGQ